MCCPLDKAQSGIFRIQEIQNSQHLHTEGKCAHVHDEISIQGTLDFTPRTFVDHLIQIFRWGEKREKEAELVDEIFHAFRSVLKARTSPEVFQFLQSFHDAAHQIEHTLHAFCFIGDFVRIASGRFAEYQSNKQGERKVDYIRTAARVMHTISHFFATAELLNELKICNLGALQPFIKYRELISACAYAVWSVSLIWRYYQTRLKNENFYSDLIIHGSGCLFEGLSYIKNWKSLAQAAYVSKAAAVAGIIHAWFVSRRLSPNEEKLEIKLDKKVLESKLGMHTHHKH